MFIDSLTPLRYVKLVGHAILIKTVNQTDDALRLILKLQNFGYGVTIVFTNEYHSTKITNTEEYDDDILYNPKLSTLTYFGGIGDALKEVFNPAQEDLKPSLIIVDSKLVLKELGKYEYLSSVNIFCTAFPAIRQQRTKTLRRCKSVTNCTKINIDYNNYPQSIEIVHDFITSLPPLTVFFSAFGRYNKEYNFRFILQAFYYFIRRQDYLGVKIMLIFGGNFDNDNINETKYLKTILGTVDSYNLSEQVVLLKELPIEKKRAILRVSYAMLYFNVFEQSNDDVILGLLLGTPLIGTDTGFAREIIIEGPRSGQVGPVNMVNVIDTMRALMSPIQYLKMSCSARLNYLKNFCNYFKVLKEIQQEDNAIL